MDKIKDDFYKQEETVDGNSYKVVFVSIFTLVVFFFISFGVLYFFEKDKANKIAQRDKAYYESLLQSDKAYYESLLQNKPEALQKSLVEDIKNGVNDAETKSAAYFITHRFFDNGGNIYEIYDYVEKHTELSFFKEAEGIYPEAFLKLKNKKLPQTYTKESYDVYLAYVEVLYKQGYADIAGLSTAANQYAGNAYFNTNQSEGERGVYLKNTERDIKKALEFLSASNDDVTKILEGKLTSSDIPARDILVGLNQHAAAIRYLEAMGINTVSTKTSREIFTFAMDYSSRFVIELNMFTSLINASTLVILDSSTTEEIKVALDPILSFDIKKPSSYKGSVIIKIINSRFEQKLEGSNYVRMDIYSKRNVLLIASRVPEFKAWLMSNGWTETDFR